MISKRGRKIFAFSFLILAVITLLAIVSSIDLSTTQGFWEDTDFNNITGTTITINVSQQPMPSFYPVNMVVYGLEGINPDEDYVTYEIYEKDSHEGSGDDPIRVGENKIVGTFIATLQEPGGTASGYTMGTWNMTLAEIALSDGDENGIHEFYFKMTIGLEQQSPRGETSRTYYESLLNVYVTGWEGGFGPTVYAYWSDRNFNVIDENVVNAEDLSNTNDTHKTNVVYPYINGIEFETEGEISPIYFQIWADGCHIVPIRTGENALVGYVGKGDTQAGARWYISLEDILKSPVYYTSMGIDSPVPYYKYFFDTLFGGLGVCFENSDIKIFVNWSTIFGNASERWLNYSNQEEIHDLKISSSDLGTSNSNVYLDISGFPPEAYNQKVYFEIMEVDSEENYINLGIIDPDGVGASDPVRTLERGNQLNATIDETGTARALWTINEFDVLSSEEEHSYEYHFSMGFYGERDYIPTGDRYNLLNVVIDGDIAGCDVSGASGEWRYSFGGLPIGDAVLKFDPLGQSVLKVVPFSFNLPCAVGTPVQIEIYEHDTSGNNDPIRTVALGNPLSLVYVNSNGTVSILWTITQDDIDSAAGEDTDGIYEFYFKIIVGQGEKDFSDSLLYVEEDESICPTVSYCTDYIDQTECNLDSCEVSSQTGLDMFEIDCALPGITCACQWDVDDSSCDFVSGYSGIGTCNFVDDPGTDTCENDGMLNYTWLAELVWDGGNSFTYEDCVNFAVASGGSSYDCVEDPVSSGEWHYDPHGLYESCIGGSNTIICPAQVQLSFWDWRNLIIVILVLAVIYLVIEINRKRKNKIKK